MAKQSQHNLEETNILRRATKIIDDVWTDAMIMHVEVKYAGVNIYATNSDYKFSISYSSFNRIRRVIADRLDSDFGDLYYEWTKVPNNFYMLSYRDRETKCIEYLNSMQKLVDDKSLDQSIVDFLFLPDTGSKIHYKTCRKLAEVLLGKIEESCTFDCERFKEFLNECYTHRRYMRWR